MRIGKEGILRLDEDVEKLISERKPQEAYALLCSKYDSTIVKRIQQQECTTEEFNSIPLLDAESILQGPDYFNYAPIFRCSAYEHTRQAMIKCQKYAEAERKAEIKRQLRNQAKPEAQNNKAEKGE